MTRLEKQVRRWRLQARARRARRAVRGWFRKDARLGHALRETARVKWPLVYCLAVLAAREYGVLPWDSWVTVVLYAAVKPFLGGIAGHVFRQQAFPDVDLSEMRRRRDPAFGLTFAGICLIYTAFVLSVGLAF